MHAFVRMVAPDESVWQLTPGDIIGRLASAALPVDDPRVSEAHALVSLRGGEFKLLALRGMFAVDGQPLQEVTLQPGLAVELAPGLPLIVVDVELPATMLALQGPELPRQILTGSASVVLQPRPVLVGRYRDDAAAHVWNASGGWRAQVRGEPARDLCAGDILQVSDYRLEVVEVPLARASAPTRWEGGVGAPLRIVAAFDSVQILREGEPPLVLDGIAARIVSELVAIGGPVGWDVLAREIWRDEADRTQLRRKWDVALARLRRRLRESRVRADLVRAAGTGSVELLLYGHDRAEDRS